MFEDEPISLLIGTRAFSVDGKQPCCIKLPIERAINLKRERDRYREADGQQETLLAREMRNIPI